MTVECNNFLCSVKYSYMFQLRKVIIGLVLEYFKRNVQIALLEIYYTVCSQFLFSFIIHSDFNMDKV